MGLGLEPILRLVADVNLKHGNVDWQPIDLRIENNLDQAIAALGLFDVLFVNPVSDGLNLVATEGMLLNRRDGVLALSEHAGVHDELGRFALSIHPIDIEEQADALYRALFMPRGERRRRRRAAVEVITGNDIGAWLTRQVRDITVLVRQRTDSRPTTSGPRPGNWGLCPATSGPRLATVPAGRLEPAGFEASPQVAAPDLGAGGPAGVAPVPVRGVAPAPRG